MKVVGRPLGPETANLQGRPRRTIDRDRDPDQERGTGAATLKTGRTDREMQVETLGQLGIDHVPHPGKILKAVRRRIFSSASSRG